MEMCINSKRAFSKKRKGFTLAELLIAVSIIAILAMASFTLMTNQMKRARDQRRRADLEQLRSALEMYRLTQTDRTYPDASGSDVDVSTLATSLTNFIAVIPSDPDQDQKYEYAEGASNQTYRLCAHLELTDSANTVCSGMLTCNPSGASDPEKECNYGVTEP